MDRSDRQENGGLTDEVSAFRFSARRNGTGRRPAHRTEKCRARQTAARLPLLPTQYPQHMQGIPETGRTAWERIQQDMGSVKGSSRREDNGAAG